MNRTGRIKGPALFIMITGLAAFLSAQSMDSTSHHSKKSRGALTATPDTAKKDSVAVKKTLPPQTTCPVMGGAINKKLYVDYKGKRIYVCCPGCIGELKSNPEKYIKILADMGQGVEVLADTSKTPDRKTGTKAKK
jgi:YHS domain-containing protein